MVAKCFLFLIDPKFPATQWDHNSGNKRDVYEYLYALYVRACAFGYVFSINLKTIWPSIVLKTKVNQGQHKGDTIQHFSTFFWAKSRILTISLFIPFQQKKYTNNYLQWNFLLLKILPLPLC